MSAWNCRLSKVYLGSKEYDNEEDAILQGNDKRILVPRKFFVFLKENVFSLYERNEVYLAVESKEKSKFPGMTFLFQRTILYYTKIIYVKIVFLGICTNIFYYILVINFSNQQFNRILIIKIINVFI